MFVNDFGRCFYKPTFTGHRWNRPGWCSRNPYVPRNQWSFRKTGTMGTLANQAEIGVWVEAQAALALGVLGGGSGVFTSEKLLEIVCAKSCNVVHYLPELVRTVVHHLFLNTLTMGTSFPRVHPRDDLCQESVFEKHYCWKTGADVHGPSEPHVSQKKTNTPFAPVSRVMVRPL